MGTVCNYHPYPSPNTQYLQINESYRFFIMIERIKKIYQGQQTITKTNQQWVDNFKLNSKYIKNAYIDLKQFQPIIYNHLFVQLQCHSKKSNQESKKTFLQMVYKFFKNLGRSVIYIKKGIMFDTQMLIIGDFLYNPDTKLLRCYSPQFMGNQGDLDTYILQQKIINFLLLVINAGLFFGTVYLIYQNYMNQRKQQQLEKQYLDKAIVLKDTLDYKCLKCKIKNHNIVYIPCFHFILCDSCATQEIQCQVCQKHITSKIKIYMS